jgi:TolA-binding protein
MRSILAILLVAFPLARASVSSSHDLTRECACYPFEVAFPPRVDVFTVSDDKLQAAVDAYVAGDPARAFVESRALVDRGADDRTTLAARAVAGFSALRLGDFSAATEYLSSVVDEPMPPDVRVEVELALGMSHIRRPEQGTVGFVSAALSPHLDRPGDGGVARLWLACAALVDGRPGRARALLEPLVSGVTGPRVRPLVIATAALADYAVGDLPRARSGFEMLLVSGTSGPYASLARYYLAEVAAGEGADSTALAYLDDISEIGSAAWFGRAVRLRLDALERLGRVDEARRAAAELAASEDEMLAREGMLRGALLAVRAGEFDDAEALLVGLPVDNADVARSWTVLADARLRSGQTLRALDATVRVPESAPDTIWAFAMLVSAKAEMARGNADVSRSRYEAIRSRVPKWSGADEVSFGLSSALLSLNLAREALQELTRLVSSCVDESLRLEALFLQAKTARRVGVCGVAYEAAREYVSAGEEAPHHFEARMLLGSSLYDLGNLTRAREVFASLVSDHPRGLIAARATHALAMTHYDEGNYAQALASFQEVSRYWHTRELEEDAALKAEWCRYYLGRHSSPTDVYRAFLRDRPESPLAPGLLVELAGAFANNGLNKKADSTYSELSVRYPDSPEVATTAVNWSRVLVSMGERDRAVLVLRGASGSDGDVERRAKLELGRLLFEMGDASAALDELSGLAGGKRVDAAAVESVLLSARIYRSIGLDHSGLSVLDALSPRCDDTDRVRLQIEAIGLELARGRTAEAERRYEATLRFASGNDRAVVHLAGARIAAYARDDDRAARLADMAVSSKGASVGVRTEARFLSAEALVRLGRTGQAEERLLAIVADDGLPEDSTEATRRLTALRGLDQ